MEIVKLVGHVALALGAAACSTTPERPVAGQVRIIAPPADLPEARRTAPAEPPVAVVPLPAPPRPSIRTAPPAPPAPPGVPPVAVVEVAPSPVPQAAPAPVVAPPSVPAPAVAAAPPATAQPLAAVVNGEPATVIYFEPDAYKFDPSYRSVLADHAKRLKAAPSLRMVIAAYADPRGARDYNLALSKKRAETVAKFLREQGVAAEQLELVHHGERRPADGAAERLAAEDRRVELEYRAR